MAAELGKVRLGNLTGTLILRMDDGSEVEVGSMDMPLDAMVTVVMPASAPAPDSRARDEGWTAKMLETLAFGAVVTDRDGDTWKRFTHGWRYEPEGSYTWSSGLLVNTFGPITAE